MAIDSMRIAKNTVFLYARLLIVMGVTLYTSRVVLDKLGVDDYGLYNVVYGVIGMLSFLNGTLIHISYGKILVINGAKCLNA